MRDELVKDLRICAEGEHCDKCGKWEVKQNGGRNACEYAICTEAADAIEELTEDNTALNGTITNLLEQIKDLGKPRWIPVTEQLPDFEGCLLCMRKAFVGDKLRYQDILYYEEGTFYMEFEDTPIPTEAITHWMPLPQPPKEE